MDFSMRSEQREMQQVAREFAQTEFAPYAAQWDADCHFPTDVIRKAAQVGFLGMYVPEACGGMGLSRLNTSIIFEELSGGCTSTAAYISIHNMVLWMIASFGQHDVKNKLIPSLISGEKLASYCLTEPGSGSDAASLKTKAVRDGDTFLLSGTKAFISGAGSTDILVVMARTGDSTPRGISAFIVPATTSGIQFGRKEEKMGWNSQPTRTITFENVRVPENHLLGQEGEGFRFAMMGLDGGRINIASCSLGTAQQALQKARDYMQMRQQFGKPLAAFQGLQFQLADMQTELIAARYMVRAAADKLDKKEHDATPYCAMAKRFASDIGFKICDQALQLHGGYGYIKEYPLERFVRDSRVHRILEGSNEIMRLIIARRLFDPNTPELL